MEDWRKEISDRIVWMFGRRSLRAKDLIEDLIPRFQNILDKKREVDCECCKWDDMGYTHEPNCPLRIECECENFLNKRVSGLNEGRLPENLFRFVKKVNEKDILGSVKDNFNKRYSIELYECVKCGKRYEIGYSYYTNN